MPKHGITNGSINKKYQSENPNDVIKASNRMDMGYMHTS